MRCRGASFCTLYDGIDMFRHSWAGRGNKKSSDDEDDGVQVEDTDDDND